MSTTHTTTAPKERPILFSAPMVRAILEGRKTQTRRIIKHMPDRVARIWHDGGEWNVENANGDMWLGRLTCPYGSPGDRLWVRETWRQFGAHILYRADYETGRDVCQWKPSIHMPRFASRITLKITEVRALRLYAITEDDAISEGIDYTMNGNNPIASFRTLWEKINGPISWIANPWVWAITFKKIEP